MDIDTLIDTLRLLGSRVADSVPDSLTDTLIDTLTDTLTGSVVDTTRAAGGIGRQFDSGLFWGVVGVVCFLLGVVLAVFLYKRGASRRQVKDLQDNVTALREDVSRMVEYLDGLPKAAEPVRNPFAKGRAAMKASPWDEAIAHFNRAKKHASGTQLVALFNLIGLCHTTPGRWNKAIASYEESARLAAEFDDRKGRAAALHNLGVILQNRGEYVKAREKYQQSLKLERELGDRRGIAITHGQLGRLAEAEKDDKTAVRNYVIAFSVFEELKSPDRDLARSDLARMQKRLGEEEFRRLYDEVVKELQQTE